MATPVPLGNAVNPKAHPGPNFGALRYSRRYTATAYYVAAAAIFLLLQLVALYAFFTGPAQSAGFIATAFAITIGMGAAGAAMYVVKGRRKQGTTLEIYDHGIRYTKPGHAELVFLFSEVKELRKRTIRGALANLTFVLADGRTCTADVSSTKDAAALQYCLNDIARRLFK
jgi:hypothetical protein